MRSGFLNPASIYCRFVYDTRLNCLTAPDAGVSFRRFKSKQLRILLRVCLPVNPAFGIAGLFCVCVPRLVIILFNSKRKEPWKEPINPAKYAAFVATVFGQEWRPKADKTFFGDGAVKAASVCRYRTWRPTSVDSSVSFIVYANSKWFCASLVLADT